MRYYEIKCSILIQTAWQVRGEKGLLWQTLLNAADKRAIACMPKPTLFPDITRYAPIDEMVMSYIGYIHKSE